MSQPKYLAIFDCRIWRAVLVCLVIGSSAQSAEIIAHRGASFDAPENTLAAVNLAWKQQANAVEIDIYLSRDSHIVLMHDKTPKRYGGPDRSVTEMTWEELHKLDVGKWKDDRYVGERVPQLADALKTIPANRRLFIEIKSGPEIVPVLKQELKKANRPPAQTCIIAFNKDVIAATVKKLPELESYWLLSMTPKKGKRPPTAAFIIKTAKELGAHGVDLGGKTEHIDAALVQQLQQAGLPCYAWTVNDPQEARRLADIGVVGITTDKPAVMLNAGIGRSPESPRR